MSDNNEINKIRRKKVSSKSKNNAPIDLSQKRREKFSYEDTSLSSRIERRNEELRRNREREFTSSNRIDGSKYKYNKYPIDDNRLPSDRHIDYNEIKRKRYKDNFDKNSNKIRIKKTQSSGSEFKNESDLKNNEINYRRSRYKDEEDIVSRKFSISNVFRNRFIRNNKEEYDYDDLYEEYSHENDTKRAMVFRILKRLIISFLIIFILISSAGFLYFRSVVADMPELTKRTVRESYINKDPVSIKRIPKELQNAVISIEDERFYKHGGVDYKSMMRSLFVNIKYGPSQGGSTIDMQVSKNLLTSNEKSLKRKVQDMYNAYRLNKIMTKDEILEAYLNNIYLGKSSYGVQAGSQLYFGKNVWELTFGQSTMLAGITNNPALYQNYEQAKKRQALVLKKMYNLGYIKENVYKAQLYRDTPFKSEIDR